MEPDREARLRRLEDAIEAWLGKQPDQPADTFLGANAPLRDLLGPMLEHGGDAAGDGLHEDVGGARLRRLGELELRREIGRGGMGVVYEAEDRKLKRRVAVKVMPRTAATSPSAIVRFWREAELSASLRHPGVVPVHSMGETEDVFYLVMELEQAASLNDVIAELRGGPVPPDAQALAAAVAGAVAQRFPGVAASTPRPAASHAHAAAELIAQVAEALAHAHHHGVIHRDVKPGNVLVDPAGRAWLTDFGLACVQGEPNVTRTGEAPGTPNYMAPEQVRGPRGLLGPAVDVFALGATLYELLTLRRAFGGDTPAAAMFEVVHREVVDPLRLDPGLPRDLVAIVHRALDKDPRRRYRDGGELAADLRAFLRGDPVAARPLTTLRRLRRWARREPWRAAALAAALFGGPALWLGWSLAVGQRPSAEVGERVLQLHRLDRELAHGFREAGEGDSAAAQAHFAAILQIQPSSEEAIAGLSVDARRRGDRAALEVLEAHPDAVRDSEALRRRQAMLLERLGETERAAAARTGLPPVPVGFDAFLDGYGHVELGHRGAAAEFAIAAKELHRAVVTSERPRAVYYYEWLHAAAHARNREATSEAEAAIRRLWPDEAASWFWIAFAADEHGDLEPALAALQRATGLDATFVAAKANRARLLRRSGRVRESIAVLQQALADGGDRAMVHRELGTSLLLAGRAREAMASYEIVLAAWPGDQATQREYAGALLEAGEVDRAHVLARALVARHAGDHEARLVLAGVQLRRREPQQALATLAPVLDQAPTARAWFLCGAAHGDRGDVPAAQQAYERALELDDGEARAATNLALIHLRAGERAKAEQLLRRALVREPAFTNARRALLRLLDQQPTAAIVMCREWLEHAPGDPEVQRHLAWSLLRSGEQAGRAEALTLARAADAATAGKDGPTLHVLGAALLATGDIDGAEAALTRAEAALDPADRFTPYYREQIDATRQQCARARTGGGR